jgi:hypothetical protein
MVYLLLKQKKLMEWGLADVERLKKKKAATEMTAP